VISSKIIKKKCTTHNENDNFAFRLKDYCISPLVVVKFSNYKARTQQELLSSKILL
jgi:hypothetical protein